MNASYLITFRDSDGTRLPLLRAVMAWLSGLPHVEVIVVEQATASRLEAEDPGHNIRTLFAFNDGPFNKSWGLNIAARHASHDLLVTGDADMLLSNEALDRALRVCQSRYDAVNPYSNLVDLSQLETQSVLQGEIGLVDIRRRSTPDRRSQGEHICFCGGICVYRRDVYMALGGMDERFCGWGGEDDAMSVNLDRYTDRLAIQRDTLAYHLWHPRSLQRYHHPHYRQNLELANYYRTCDQMSLERLRAEGRKSMGKSVADTNRNQ